MNSHSRTDRPRGSINGLMVGLFYGGVLFMSALIASHLGEQGGTFLPVLVSAAPLSIADAAHGYYALSFLSTPFLWAALGVAISGCQKRPNKAPVKIALAVHYVGALVSGVAARPAEWKTFLGGLAGDPLRGQPPDALPWLVLYLCGQVTVWLFILRE